MNLMSNIPTLIDLEFYVIPVEWMQQVLPYLQGLSRDEERVRECKITNASLLLQDDSKQHAVSDEEESADVVMTAEDASSSTESLRRKRRLDWREKEMQHAAAAAAANSESLHLKPGLKHGEDYFLVGKNVWTVLSSKFGYDYALPRKVKRSHTAESRLGVHVYHDNQWFPKVDIPPSGRFSYETAAPLVANDDDDDDQETNDLVSTKEKAYFVLSFVSVDRSCFLTHCLTNYQLLIQYPEWNGHNAMDSTLSSTYDDTNSEPILMLPPSTTPAAYLPDDGDDDDDAMDFQQESPQKRKRHASGLANLGNTCFMNSTLQCLAHTDPLRRYFVTSEYQTDLNRDNVLGTGGELATEFANLLREMWISNPSIKSPLSSFHTDVVYPRKFKQALGRHAEQFMGYDQHDSQEFATYLLDALHEDTNRITKKPYIEKPEQKEGETDEEAAATAWHVHLQREDSRVLENFMGQVKSRVQCPTPGCGRVSTTFDPFMYLSVPIPGATDVTIPVTLVTLENGNFKFNIRLNKTSSIETLSKRVAEKFAAFKGDGKEIAVKNLYAADVWNSEVWGKHAPTQCVDVISLPQDKTNIYELVGADVLSFGNDADNTAAVQALKSDRKYRRHRLDTATLTKLNQGDNWMDALEHYMKQPLGISVLTSPKRFTHEDRAKFYQKLEAFIDLCHASSDGHDSEHDAASSDDAEMMSSDAENPQGEKSKYENPQGEESQYGALPSLEERCQGSSSFRNVNTVHDLAILEYCSMQARKHILRLLEESTSKNKEGIVINIVMRHKQYMASPRVTSYGNSSAFSIPLCIRIPATMTVYGLREVLAQRLGKYLNTDYLLRKPPPPPSESMENTKIAASNVTPDESNGEGSDQSDAMPMETSTEQSNGESTSQISSFDIGSPELLIMRQIPLSCKKEDRHSPTRPLGMQLASFGSLDGHPTTLANKDDELEQQIVADLTGNHGTVQLNWPDDLCKRVFDVDTYGAVELVEDPAEVAREAEEETITVKDCIDKYCLMEQLDETEMWYCNQCKDHVRAWKQFHLYRSPPILIIHLKRFQYSSSTHRRDKIDKFIDFPLTGLDLTNEFTQWTEDEKPIYDCYAVSNHFGGLGGGHYTAFALSDEGTWTTFDDSRVTTEVDPKDVVSSAAYVLYYRRRDVELDGPDGEVDPPLPAIVQEDCAYFQPQEESNGPIDMGDDDILGSDMHTDMQSATSSNKSVSSQMDASSVEVDPYGRSFADELSNFNSNLPAQ